MNKFLSFTLFLLFLTPLAFATTPCEGNANVESVCGLSKDPDKKLHRKNLEGQSLNSNHQVVTPGTEPTSVGGNIEPDLVGGWDFKDKDSSYSNHDEKNVDCESQKSTAETCCTDPTTCLGGTALSTMQNMNTVISQVGPAFATGAQGFGKDMSGMCETLQMMAGTGAGLSMAASGKCSMAISACKKTCNNKIAERCKAYLEAKNFCLETAHISSSVIKFKETAETIGSEIKNLKQSINHCTAQKGKSDQMMQNMTSLMTSAINAQMCKWQAKAMRTEKECKKDGGHWKNKECIMPEDTCKDKGGEWNPETKKCIPRTIAELNPTPPPTPPPINNNQHTQNEPTMTTENAQKEETSNNDDDDDGNDTAKKEKEKEKEKEVGGGEQEEVSNNSRINMPGSSDGGTDAVDTSNVNNPSGNKAGSRSSGKKFSNFGRGGFRRGYGRFKRKGRGGGEDSSLSMGGGGFAGYGGRGGSNESGNGYANLGLSKKKLKELKEKKGVTRVSASEAGGAHQNIFERITKRFQSLCKNKLNCR